MAWAMTKSEKRYDKQATGEFKQKYGKKRKFNKAERQKWWTRKAGLLLFQGN